MKRTSGISEKKQGSYDLASLSRLPSVIEPKQVRSRKMFEGVLSALEHLLKSKRFSEITIPEIAAEAGCSAAAIYGRFKDKNSILAVLHQSLRDRIYASWDKKFNAELWRQRTIDELSVEFCSYVVRYYTENKNLFSAALTNGNQEIYERAAMTIRSCAGLVCLAVEAIDDRQLDAEDRRRIELGVLSVFALTQQRILFHPTSFGTPDGNSDAAFAAELAFMLLSVQRRH